MKCKAVCDEITHVFQIKTFLLKFLVGERFRVDSHSLHYQFIVVWSRHLVLASTFAFHEEGVYFIVLQDWTSRFIVVWANILSWHWALHSKTQTLHIGSHEWSWSIYIPLCVYVWDKKTIFSMCFSNHWYRSSLQSHVYITCWKSFRIKESCFSDFENTTVIFLHI